MGLTPYGAAEVIKAGHQVIIEKDAGFGSLFPNERYEAVGCEIVDSHEEVWKRANLLVKVKEPHESEYGYLRKDLIVFDYLHLASMPELTEVMVKSGVTGVAFELVQTPNGRHPLLDPMSEVAGKLSILNGSYFLLAQNGGRGVLLGGTYTNQPRHVMIIGGGVAGTCAAEMAIGAGAKTTVYDIDALALERLKVRFGSQISTAFSTQSSLAEGISKADLVVGAVLIPGAKTPKLITEEMIKTMKQGSVFIDVSIDQGGLAETIRPTDLDNPTYEMHGVIHYGVCNMPAQTARTSTQALEAATLPYIIKLANGGLDSLRSDSNLRPALNCHDGVLTNQAISEATGIAYKSIEETLGIAFPHG